MDLVEKGHVCVVTVTGDRSYVFGVYENMELAMDRVQGYIDIGILSDKDVIRYTPEIVWRRGDSDE